MDRSRVGVWTWCEEGEEDAHCSSVILQPKSGSPLLMLSLDEEDGGGCRVYNPEEDRIYETKSDFSGYRFLASSGKWFLVMDSRSFLYIIDVFSEERTQLPPLESFKSVQGFRLERVGDDKFCDRTNHVLCSWTTTPAEQLRGLLWVDDNSRDYVVVWQFDDREFLGYCKRGDDHYREITTRLGVGKPLKGLLHMVLQGYHLYILTSCRYIRHLDLFAGQDGGFKDLSDTSWYPMWYPLFIRDEAEKTIGNKVLSNNASILVTTSGDVWIVFTRAFESTSGEIHRLFRIFKRDANRRDPREIMLSEVFPHTLTDDAAMFLDFGTTVPANPTLAIQPKSIYFTRDDRLRRKKLSCLDICIHDYAAKTTKRFPSLNTLKLKDAQWFIPS